MTEFLPGQAIWTCDTVGSNQQVESWLSVKTIGMLNFGIHGVNVFSRVFLDYLFVENNRISFLSFLFTIKHTNTCLTVIISRLFRKVLKHGPFSLLGYIIV